MTEPADYYPAQALDKSPGCAPRRPVVSTLRVRQALVGGPARTSVGFGPLATDPYQQRGTTVGLALRPNARGACYGLETVMPLLAVAAAT